MLRAIIDSSFTHVLPDSIAGAPEVLLEDHFGDVYHEWVDWGDYAAEWVSDSLPDVPRDLIRDFRRVAAGRSRIEPFELGRGKLHLLADSTLARFFGKGKPGWDGFYRAFPRGSGIVSLSRVGLSRDGHWAVLYVGQQSNWLVGAGDLYVLHNDGGIWRIRYRRMLWLS